MHDYRTACCSGLDLLLLQRVIDIAYTRTLAVSMRHRSVTVQCLSLCLYVCPVYRTLHAAAAGLLLWARPQKTSIDSNSFGTVGL